MAEERCARHDMILRDCADCNPRHPVPVKSKLHGGLTGTDQYQVCASPWEGLAAMAADPPDTGPVIEARYSGHCRACGERWEPGDLIAYGEDEGGWLCEGCAS